MAQPLALAFCAGSARYALAARDVIEVLPRRALREVPGAPHGVVGLLPFRDTLTPVVDLSLLLLGRTSAPWRSTRLIVVEVPAASGTRYVALVAERVVDFVPIGATVPGLRLPAQPWLGEHLADEPDLPQLLDPAALLPAPLEALFTREAPA